MSVHKENYSIDFVVKLFVTTAVNSVSAHSQNGGDA